MNTEQLTFTRFIAAILIVIFHFGNNVYPFNSTFLAPAIHHANLGVSYFFTLSGFVMVIAYGRKAKKIDYGVYLKNRAARILPLYYFAMVLMLIYFFIRIFVLKMVSNYTPTLNDTFLNIFLIQGWFFEKATTVNMAAWSLSAEAFFYIVFPLFFNKLYSRISLMTLFIISSLFFVVSQLCFHFLIYKYSSQTSYFLYNPLLHLSEFVVGNFAGFMFIHKARTLTKYRSLVLLFVFIVALLLVYMPIHGINYHNGFFVIFFAPIIYLLAIDKGRLSHAFRKKALIYLGEISYGIYILQFPVYFFFTATLTYFGFKINQPLFYIFLIVLIMISSLSYEFIEKPFRRILRSKLTR